MTDDKTAREIQRARDARSIIENPLLVEALATIERTHLEAWLSTKPAQRDVRERLWYAVQASIELKGFLENVIATGTMAQHRLDEERREQEDARAEEPERDPDGDLSISGAYVPD